VGRHLVVSWSDSIVQRIFLSLSSLQSEVTSVQHAVQYELSWLLHARGRRAKNFRGCCIQAHRPVGAIIAFWGVAQSSLPWTPAQLEPEFFSLEKWNQSGTTFLCQEFYSTVLYCTALLYVRSFFLTDAVAWGDPGPCEPPVLPPAQAGTHLHCSSYDCKHLCPLRLLLSKLPLCISSCSVGVNGSPLWKCNFQSSNGFLAIRSHHAILLLSRPAFLSFLCAACAVCHRNPPHYCMDFHLPTLCSTIIIGDNVEGWLQDSAKATSILAH